MNTIIGFISSAIVFTHYLNGLIFKPYKTMRKISQEVDYNQILLITGLVYIYFVYATIIRTKTIHPFVISTKTSVNIFFFGLTFFLTTGYFYFYGKIINKIDKFKPFVFTFAYSLLPTFVWFFMTSTLYLFFPPPRSTNILGLLLSSVFFIISLTLFFWKINLYYLAVRFSTRSNFYQIMLMTVGFVIWFIPYSYWLYKLRIFRIPFI